LPRTGILGGAFNPPHLGHLVCAQEALVRLGLERVLLVPTGRPPHRTIEDDPGAEARLAMAELAVGEDERLAVSRVELDRPGPSYTADTLEELRGLPAGDGLVLVLGADQAASLREWHRPERVLELAELAVVARRGWDRETVSARLAGLPGTDRTRFVDMPLIDVSSTDLRRRVAAGLPIRYLVPDTVARFVAERGLYRAGAAAGARA
jgi:nicotinate-nucleotide adenylyltransferase